MPTKKQNRRIARFELAQSTRAAPTPPEVKPPWASVYTPTIGERICDLVVNGKTLRQIALEEVWAPNARIMYYWLEEHPEFARAFAAARELYADDIAREIVTIADEARTDLDIAKLPHRIHAREWLAVKRSPRHYGDRRMIDTVSNVNIRNITKIDVSHLSSDEILIAEKALMKAIGHSSHNPEDDE
jgi:hypothetical protein